MDAEHPEAADDERTMLVVGRLGRPHGLKGELTVTVRTDDAVGRFVAGAAFDTEPDVGQLVIAEARRNGDRWVLRLRGVETREAAETLRQVALVVDAADDAPQDNAWPIADLVGLRAMTSSGELLGTVVDLQSGAAQDLLVVLAGRERVLVPFVAALVPAVDVAGGTVTIDPPGGLFPEDS